MTLMQRISANEIRKHKDDESDAVIVCARK